MRFLLAPLAVALLAWVAWALLMFSAQRAMVFPGAGYRAPPVALPAGGEFVAIPGPTIPGRAILLRAQAEGPRPALLFAHGNAEFAIDNAASFRAWTEVGIHVLLVEYPGYDGAPGAPTRQTIDALWLGAFDWLAARPDVNAGRIVGLGRSLGSGPTAMLAAHRPLAAVVLQSAFASTERFAHARLLPGFLVRDRWDNVAALRAFDGPVFASHGRHDTVIPPTHGRDLASLPGVHLEWLDCGHNDCPYEAPEYQARVLAFLAARGVLAR